MKFATLCSGIGSPETAWVPLGWDCAFHSEIEPFPSAVLKHHQPNVPNYGDMTKYKEWPDHKDENGNTTIDLICAGCPCQSFSVAGLRKGLDDPRGNLTLTYLAILDKYRPRWMVYENVPGLLSDKTGAFGAFIGGLAELGYGFAYRILDAQFIRVESHPGAVPQRRRRLFVVGYLGDWRPAAAVLFERESLQGHTAPRREAGKGFAGSPANGSGVSSELYENHPADSRITGPHEVCQSVVSRYGTGGGNIPLVKMGVPDVTTAFTQNQAGDVLTGEVMHNLGTNSNATGRNAANVHTKMQVRRLTPTECERLQGFPDGHTAIPYKGKPAADGVRYKALGNSMAVNVMSWIGQRIQMCDEVMKELNKGDLTNDR